MKKKVLVSLTAAMMILSSTNALASTKTIPRTDIQIIALTVLPLNI
ncbi:MAG: hypothetical protein ACLTM8_00230 [Veillonella parvula]